MQSDQFSAQIEAQPCSAAASTLRPGKARSRVKTLPDGALLLASKTRTGILDPHLRRFFPQGNTHQDRGSFSSRVERILHILRYHLSDADVIDHDRNISMLAGFTEKRARRHDRL